MSYLRRSVVKCLCGKNLPVWHPRRFCSTHRLRGKWGNRFWRSEINTRVGAVTKSAVVCRTCETSLRRLLIRFRRFSSIRSTAKAVRRVTWNCPTSSRSIRLLIPQRTTSRSMRTSENWCAGSIRPTEYVLLHIRRERRHVRFGNALELPNKYIPISAPNY